MKKLYIIDKNKSVCMTIEYDYAVSLYVDIDDGFIIKDITLSDWLMKSDPRVMSIMLSVETMLKDSIFIKMVSCNERQTAILYDIHDKYRYSEGYEDALMTALQRYIISKCCELELYDEEFKVITQQIYENIIENNTKEIVNNDNQFDKKEIIRLLSTISETLKDLANEINKVIK